MGSNLTSSDSIDGGAGNDTLIYKDVGGTTELNGVVNVEKIVFTNTSTSATVVTNNNLVASGQTLIVDASSINSANAFTWNGAAETNGRFNITGGAGDDSIIGGAGNDTIDGGAGTNDIAGYSAAATNYSIQRNDDGTLTVTDNRSSPSDGTDTLSNIEGLSFNGANSITPISTLSDKNNATNTIAENSANGTVVGLTATATGTSVTYSLTDSANGRFAINSSSGVVTVADGTQLNYENATSHNITVKATSTNGSFTTHVFSIAVTNLDEVAPTFTSSATAPAINENSGAGQVVYTASSTDSTDYVSGNTTYSLKTGLTDDAAQFSIDAATGKVSLIANPNYEAQSGYSFTVVATDAAGNASEQAVSLAINNVNESPTGSATASLADGTEDTAYTISATDLLQGFSDVDGDSLSVSGLTANHGSLVDNHNGTWTFTPAANYNGKVNLNYSVTDGTLSVVATQSFSLVAVNDAPILSGTQAILTAGTEDTAYTVKANDLL